MAIIAIVIVCVIIFLISECINELCIYCNNIIIKDSDIYDLLKLELVEKIPYNCSRRLTPDIIVGKKESILFPYYVEDVGIIIMWSKSAKLIRSFYLTKRGTKCLEKDKLIAKYWDKQKNKQ